jgi:hypothetical protein
MRILTCLGFLLVATAASAQTYTTVVHRDTKTVTTGPNTTTQIARTSTSTTYTTVTRTGAYQPMGAGGYHPMGR